MAWGWSHSWAIVRLVNFHLFFVEFGPGEFPDQSKRAILWLYDGAESCIKMYSSPGNNSSSCGSSWFSNRCLYWSPDPFHYIQSPHALGWDYRSNHDTNRIFNTVSGILIRPKSITAKYYNNHIEKVVLTRFQYSAVYSSIVWPIALASPLYFLGGGG